MLYRKVIDILVNNMLSISENIEYKKSLKGNKIVYTFKDLNKRMFKLFISNSSMDLLIRYNSTIESGTRSFKIQDCCTLYCLNHILNNNINNIDKCNKIDVTFDTFDRCNAFKVIETIISRSIKC